MTKTVLNLLWNKISKNFSTKKLVIDALANKQDLIIDIATIRSNSLSAYLKPSTGIPAGDLASGVVPTNVSSFTNDAKYVTEDDMQVDVIDANGHDYVEIGGIKWATMNVGANSVTDTGLYFQLGDTQGYTAAQVGIGSGQKAFKWADYKYGNGTNSPGNTDMTKYNSTDGKKVLDISDDAARANMGGLWRMPTTAEYAALGAAVNAVWTDDYQGSGVAGLVCTDKTDSSKVLFFPAAGDCYYGSVHSVGSDGFYWSSSIYNSSSVQYAYGQGFRSSGVNWQTSNYRYYGFSVRGVLGTSKGPKYATKAELADVATSGSYNDLNDKPTIPTVITNQEIALLFDPYRGHAYVEIAGIKWATMNIGATSETGYGNYYKYGLGAEQYNSAQANYAGTEDLLDLSVDTARQVWGGNWRMPTETECESLMANTNHTWETNFNDSGVNGFKLTDKTDSSKYIFIPAAGHWIDGSHYNVGSSSNCWSSSLYDSSKASNLFFDYSEDDDYLDEFIAGSGFNYGFSVRAVAD